MAVPEQHICKNCGAVEDLKTGVLTYKGDNPLFKENQELINQVKTLEVKNKYLAKLAGAKKGKKQPKLEINEPKKENKTNGQTQKENPWHF